MIIFFTTYWNVTTERSPKQDYFLTNEIMKKFKGTRPIGPSKTETMFDDIRTIDDYYLYLDSNFKQSLFQHEEVLTILI